MFVSFVACVEFCAYYHKFTNVCCIISHFPSFLCSSIHILRRLPLKRQSKNAWPLRQRRRCAIVYGLWCDFLAFCYHTSVCWITTSISHFPSFLCSSIHILRRLPLKRQSKNAWPLRQRRSRNRLRQKRRHEQSKLNEMQPLPEPKLLPKRRRWKSAWLLKPKPGKKKPQLRPRPQLKPRFALSRRPN